MKKRIIFSIMVVILTISFNLFTKSLQAQTTGNLTFSVTTTSTGNFSPRHVIAIWIEKSDGTFVKTKLKKAAARVQYLNQWVAKSGSNVVDATTGATVSAHQTESITWNATDVTGATVADGDYKLWIQMAWSNNNGPTYSIAFTKNATAAHITPADQTNYTGMVLDWTPNTAGIAENQNQSTFTVTPNPVTSQSSINYSLKELTDVTIGLYDVTGKLINVLFDDNQTAGNYSLSLASEEKLKPGTYFVKMNTGKTQHTERVLILK
ncbi:MAG: DUF2271 domain-containing protein [Bacteroidetes bacterium]|nr:DUF2271 domain-containing protein [Bacteroidota bacterium]